MDSVFEEQLRGSLSEKRERISSWLENASTDEKKTTLGVVSEEGIQAHLGMIEDCLEKASTNELGICEICHESVDSELLEMDYTSSVCLAHFTEEQINNLETELELASMVQKSLLPQQLPENPHLEISAFSRPAQVIGGDYFDFFTFQDRTQGISIADVAGHGVSAALHMASIQALLRSLIPNSQSPLEVLEHIQRLLIHNIHFTNFVTLVLASFDPASRVLRYVNAGHNPPLHLRGDQNGKATENWLMPTGAAVGLIENPLLKEASIQLGVGDLLVFYTDGVTEAMDFQQEQFGYERLSQVVRTDMKSSTREIVQCLRQSLLDFCGQVNLEDDATILVCKILT
jgi:sigma-B regulation protein RsbU (phosphoserine phosphatase)